MDQIKTGPLKMHTCTPRNCVTTRLRGYAVFGTNICLCSAVMSGVSVKVDKTVPPGSLTVGAVLSVVALHNVRIEETCDYRRRKHWEDFASQSI